MDSIGTTNPVLLLRSGSAAATQYVARSCHHLNHICSNRYGRDLSVSELAQYCSNMITEQQQSMSLIVAGLSPSQHNHRGRGGIPFIYTIAPSGALLQETVENYAAAGSGSVYILGYLQEYFGSLMKHHDATTTAAAGTTAAILSKQDAIDLCLRALQLAKEIDASSGGWTRLIILEQEHGSNAVTQQYQVIQNSNNDGEMTMPSQPLDSSIPLKGFADPIKK